MSRIDNLETLWFEDQVLNHFFKIITKNKKGLKANLNNQKNQTL